MDNAAQYTTGTFPQPQQIPGSITSLLDCMIDGREYESIISTMNGKLVQIDMVGEIKRAMADIAATRSRPIISYIANNINPILKSSRAIDYTDDLPFSEMVNSITETNNGIDILLVTGGGNAAQVTKFVDMIRAKFTDVCFIIPNMCMSAGTIFAMSGDNIIMNANATLGPIDPQVVNKDGQYIPAQAILALIQDIQKRGQDLLDKSQPIPWTDLQILRQMDSREIGNALSQSKYSIELVENYLYDFKFRTWLKHHDDTDVTDEQRKATAKQIAEKLCDHSLWKIHGRGITRVSAWDICRLKITHSETIPGLDRALRRYWALICWIFENTGLVKLFLSKDYSLIRSEIMLPNIPQQNK